MRVPWIEYDGRKAVSPLRSPLRFGYGGQAATALQRLAHTVRFVVHLADL